jgi:hypothetical protein
MHGHVHTEATVVLNLVRDRGGVQSRLAVRGEMVGGEIVR